MGLLNRIKMLWRAAVGSAYSWAAMDIVLPRRPGVGPRGGGRGRRGG
ncbi:MAG: hypothetical protein LUG48_01755, partial [Klebsiella quasipneumoniae]|nr:hypothetical protein [Klebsiella quasipneumoniae]